MVEISVPIQGFSVKNILVIGDNKGENGEYQSDFNAQILSGNGRTRYIIMNDGISDNTRVDRIVEQIKILGEYAKSNSKSKPGQITRVVTDEFSFYTKNTPLTIEEYKSIINKASEALKTLPPNLVLVVSSMPVLWPDGCLRNAVLHIQSPKDDTSEPIIHHFSKESCSPIDPVYSRDNTPSNYYDFRADDYESPNNSPDVVLKNTKAQCKDKNQYKSAILVQGMGVPPMIDAIDVCLDHCIGVGMRNAGQLLRKLSEPPLYISHIITSNSIDKKINYLTSPVVHADWKKTNVEDVFEKKNEPIYAAFGEKSSAFVYGAKRANIIHSELFDLVVKNTKKSITDFLDNNDNTLLHEAILLDKKSNPQCTHRKKRLDKILQHFDNDAINRPNKQGDTPLHLAVQKISDENMLLRFVERGARLNIKNSAGITPIEIAYQKNNTHLIGTLCNKVLNNEKSYLAHRGSILELIGEIKEKPIKEKLARGALLKEILISNSDESTIIGLLKETGNPSYFIQNNLTFLLSKVAIQKNLYEYLITLKIFERANPKQLDELPVETKLQLIKQALSETPVSEERINLFLNGLSVLQYPFSDSECDQLLAFKALFPQEMSGLSEEEKEVVAAYLSNNYQRIVPICKKVEINSSKIAGVFSPAISQNVESWIKEELKKIQYQESIRTEFNKGSAADLDSIQTSLSQNIHLDEPCGLNNGLTIGEQLIAQALISKGHLSKHQLQTLLDSVESQLTDVTIKKIADSFNIPPNKESISNSEDLDNITKWIYQERIKNELEKSFRNPKQQPNNEIILDTICQGKRVWDQQYFQFSNALGSLVYLSIAEQTIAQYIFNPQMLEKVCLELKSQNMNINKPIIEKIANTWNDPSTPNNTQKVECVKQQIYQILIKIDPLQTLINEFQNGQQANTTILVMALSQPGIRLEEDCGLNNELTIGEQAIAQAFISKNTILPQQLQFILNTAGLPLTEESIQKIVDSFNKEPNRTQVVGYSSDAIKNWIYQERVKNELKKQFPLMPNADIIATALSHGKEIWDIQYNEVPYASPFGPFNLTIAEQAIAQAYISHNPVLLEKVYSQLKAAGKNLELSKIFFFWDPNANFFATNWIVNELEKIRKQELIKDEFKKGQAAHLNIITNALSQYPQTQVVRLDQPCGLNNELNLGEQVIAQAFINKSTIPPQQLQFIFNTVGALLTGESIQKIADSIIKEPNVTHGAGATPQSVKVWIYQQRIINELMKSSPLIPNVTIIDEALSQGPGVWNIQYNTFPYQGPSGTFNLTIAEQTIAQAYMDPKYPSLLEKAYSQLKSAHKIPIDVAKISNLWHPNSTGPANWINQELVKIETKQVIINEFKKGNRADLGVIQKVLSQNINLDADCGLCNGLTIREQTIAQAFLSEANTVQVKEILKKIDAQSTIDEKKINKVARVLFEKKEQFKQFSIQIASSIIQDELQQGSSANLSSIQMALSQNIRLEEPCSLNNELTVGEQAVAQAFISKGTILPEQLQFILNTAGSSLSKKSIQKIADSFTKEPNIAHGTGATPHAVKIWIHQERIKNELMKKFPIVPNGTIIEESLSEGPEVWDIQYNVFPYSGSSGPFNLTIAEQAIAQAYISKKPALLATAYFQLKAVGKTPIDIIKISNWWYPSSNFIAYHWLFNELEKIKKQELIKEEFNKGPAANLNIIIDNILFQSPEIEIIHLDEPCGLNNGLTLGEQAIAQTFINKSTIFPQQLQFIFDTAGLLLTDEIIQKIADSFMKEPNIAHGAGAIPHAVKIWIYQERIKNELVKTFPLVPNDTIIAETLSRGPEVWDIQYNVFPYSGPSGSFNLTIAEQAIAQAYLSQNPILLQKAYSQLKAARKTPIDVLKISNILFPQNNIVVANWINQEIIKFEFKKHMLSSKKALLNALSPNINLNEDCGLNNGLTIKEQTISQAYQLRDPRLLQKIIHIGGVPINTEKVARSLVNPESTQNQQTINSIIDWINQEFQKIVTAEFKKEQHANLNLFLTALLQPGIKLDEDCGLNNGLTIKEQAIAQAFISKKNLSPKQLQSLLDNVGSGLSENIIQKIAESFNIPPNKGIESNLQHIDDVSTWIYKERIKNELGKSVRNPKQQPNNEIILEALSHGKGVLDTPYYTYPNALGGPVDLSIAEQTIAQYVYNPETLERVCLKLKSQSIMIDESLVDKIATTWNNPLNPNNLQIIEDIKQKINQILAKIEHKEKKDPLDISKQFKNKFFGTTDKEKPDEPHTPSKSIS